MKNKLEKFYENNKLTIKTVITVLVAGIMLFILFQILTNNTLKEYSTDTYTIKYDRSWKLKTKEDTKIKLKHKSKSEINIEILALEGYKYKETKDIIDDLLYSIGLENSDYKLLQKKKTSITKNNYDGYKILYENNESQVLVVIAKKTDKILLFTYEAKNEYFDILLDSVESIIYNFNINDEKYKITNTVKVATKDIEFSKNDKLVKDLKENKEYQIANNNYQITLSIPSNFLPSKFESTYGYYNYRELKEGSINLTVSVLNRNIYEYLEKNDVYGSLYNDFRTQRESTDETYSNFKEALTKITDKEYEKYLYKSQYNYKGYSSTTKYEHYYIIYEIDKNHVLIFKLESKNNKIPKELINKIKFVDAINYSSNITKEIKDNKLISTLKRFTDYAKTKYEEITIKLPTNFKEIDYKLNIYENRYYGLNYDKRNDIYQYDIKYHLTSSSMTSDRIVSNISSDIKLYQDNGNYQELISNGKITLHGKEYEIYSGGYTNYGVGYNGNYDNKKYYLHKKLLIHKLENGGCITIEIDGNGSEINEQLLNDLTDIDIIIKEYK